jgi:hypothetical protein
MDYYYTSIMSIFLIKILFIILKLINVYLTLTKQTGTQFAKNVNYWDDRVEFVYKAVMSALVIYLFRNCSKPNPICIYDKETKLLLFIFGFVLLYTASWNTFIKESPIVLSKKKN